jgi:hypothetical protein
MGGGGTLLLATMLCISCSIFAKSLDSITIVLMLESERLLRSKQSPLSSIFTNFVSQWWYTNVLCAFSTCVR